MADQPNFGVIVVGSGMSGGYAAKEFAEKGMKVLVIERGKDTKPGKDYIGENLDPWDMEFRDKINPQLADADYAIQSKCYALRESNRNLFINDREKPYSTEEDAPFTGFAAIRLAANRLCGRVRSIAGAISISGRTRPMVTAPIGRSAMPILKSGTIMSKISSASAAG